MNIFKKEPQHYKPKKKTEFSKKWLIGCIIISLFYTLLSYILAFFDKNTVEALSIEVINTLWVTSGISFIGYILQNSVRAFTSSKFGIPQKETDNKQIIQEETDNEQII